MASRGAAAIRTLTSVSFVLYAAWALAFARWWLSGAAAPAVAWLLWRRHPRARFASYVLLSVVAARAALGGAWEALAWALTTIAVLQAPAATRMWPRLRPGLGPRSYGVE